MQQTPLPWRKLIVVFLVQFVEAFTSSSLFPYVPFLIKDFGMAADEKEVGYYAGILASMFFFCMSLQKN